MTRELLEAINIQAKREGFFWPVLRAIIFEQLAQRFPDKSLLSILKEHRGGSWGADHEAGLLPAPSLRSPDIRHGRIDYSQAETRYYTSKELEKHRLQSGDILVIKSNGSLDLVGKSQLFNSPDTGEHVTASNFVLVLRPDETQVDPLYLDWFLKSPQALVWRVDKQRTTTGLRNLDSDGYLATSVPVPKNVDVQREVTGIFEAIERGDWPANPYFDVAIAERAKKVADIFEELALESERQEHLLTKLKQAILQEAIQGKLTTDWRAKNPGVEPASQLLQRIQAEKARLIAAKKLRKEKPLPQISSDEIPFAIPTGWEWCRLGAISRFFDYRGKTPNKISGGVRLITAKNVKFGRFSDTPRDYVSEESYRRHMVRGFPENGDILFTTEAPLGNACQLEMDEPYALGQRLITLNSAVG